MAYLRKETGKVEIPYSLEKVWTAIQKVLVNLEWDTEQIDNSARHIKAKTQGGLMSWPSVLLIDLASVDKKVTRLTVAAETPVTTITSMVEFGRARHRIDMFLRELAGELAR